MNESLSSSWVNLPPITGQLNNINKQSNNEDTTDKSVVIDTIDESISDKSIKFLNIANSLAELYDKKNHDYGDSFSKSVAEFGYTAALVRIGDKFNRLKSLILNGNQKVSDESIIDTLKDMASYCIMLAMEFES